MQLIIEHMKTETWEMFLKRWLVGHDAGDDRISKVKRWKPNLMFIVFTE
jgi:hypothetical protein